MFGRNTTIDKQLDAAVEQLIKSGGKEQILPIVQAGEPVLRQRTQAYTGQLGKRTLARLVASMRTTMLEAPGVGLAAPQIGLGLALAVVEDHARAQDEARAVDTVDAQEPYELRAQDPSAQDAEGAEAPDPREIAEFPFHVIINPSYEPIGTRTCSFYEGCLSFDGYQAVRTRWLDIVARWQDESGISHEERLHGWPARIFQHETDHLSGELYIDQAVIRSLTTTANLEEYWAYDPVPTEAAEELGFDL